MPHLFYHSPPTDSHRLFLSDSWSGIHLPALTAVVAQSEYANLQRVGGNYWASAETLGQICVNGNPDGKDPQTLIEDAVAGITAPVTQ